MAGDFYLQGGSLNVFTPVLALMKMVTYLISTMMVSTHLLNPLQQISSVVLVKICYSIISPLSKLYVPLFTSGQTAAFGGAYLSEDMDEDGIYYYDRYLAVGQGDVGSSLDGV